MTVRIESSTRASISAAGSGSRRMPRFTAYRNCVLGELTHEPSASQLARRPAVMRLQPFQSSVPGVKPGLRWCGCVRHVHISGDVEVGSTETAISECSGGQRRYVPTQDTAWSPFPPSTLSVRCPSRCASSEPSCIVRAVVHRPSRSRAVGVS